MLGSDVALEIILAHWPFPSARRIVASRIVTVRHHASTGFVYRLLVSHEVFWGCKPPGACVHGTLEGTCMGFFVRAFRSSE